MPTRASAHPPSAGTPPAARSQRRDTPGRARTRRPKLAVWKFASCDGCQLSLLDCEDELLAVAGAVEIANFPEASRAVVKGPYDLSLVEGSVTTPHDLERIQEVRRQSKYLVTIGACATSGGIQALRNFQDVKAFTSIVYASPQYIHTLATSTAISAHVKVDYELHGCPINKHQLLEVVGAYLHGRRPNIQSHSVCIECKLRGNVCVTVAHGTPCLGPVTHAGCDALCPSYNRGCFGCYGPQDSANTPSIVRHLLESGQAPADLQRAFRTYNALSEPFEKAACQAGVALSDSPPSLTPDAPDGRPQSGGDFAV